MARTLLITGGAGFIGSALIRYLVENSNDVVVNVDKLTYAGNLESLESVADSERYYFEQVDICDRAAMEELFERYEPDGVIHLAAESHVDRSIDGPAAFIQTNIVGTSILLEVAREYWRELEEGSDFRFHHVSTDEVYGSLGEEGFFTEQTSYDPSSPYSASKASSDHLVRAWNRTYGMPVVITNCSNNYGPYQFPEKLMPVVILKAVDGESIPVYGTGENVRDWLYVEDHVRALMRVFEDGEDGRTYNIGGHCEKTNLEVVGGICAILDERLDGPDGGHASLIEFVEDRPGHDLRYAIDASRIGEELGWAPEESFASGLEKTVDWYLEHRDWCERAVADKYERLNRLGKGEK